MGLENQKQEFYDLISPSYPNDWEVDEALEILAQTNPLQRQALLRHVPAIWPVSNSLCFSYLSAGVKGLSSFSLDLLSEWVRQILSRYEQGGLRSAREFMSDIDKNFVDPLRGRAGVTFMEMVGRMLPYIRGVSGVHLDLAADGLGRIWTDTRTIYLPDRLNLFSGKEDNLLFYKFIITMQWGFIAVGTYRQAPTSDDFSSVRARDGLPASGFGREAFFCCFPDPELARMIFHVLEFARAFAMIGHELPGLARQARPLCLRLLQGYSGSISARAEKIRDLLRGIITGDGLSGQHDSHLPVDCWSGGKTFQRLAEVFAEIESQPGELSDDTIMILLGQFNFAAAHAILEEQRLEEREIFITLLAAVIEGFKGNDLKEESGQSGLSAETDALLLIPSSGAQDHVEENPRMILVNNEEMVMPDELARVLERIEADLGAVPSAYIQAAVGMAGQGRSAAGIISQEEKNRDSEAFSLDEWDYRRLGYRKDWCSLYEKELPQIVSNFVPITLQKHRGLITKVKRQFEMLRTTHRFVKRRRYGDDLDFDAIIEALGDQRAGFAPSDRLFIRLLRDKRDIVSLFLVDMSNSTEGWIGSLIKESLVILGEVMEVVGDRYGMYGFSGMRRSRCELYHVKHIDEVYGDEVRQRIAAIGPREYTRMAPPLRYLTRKLLAIDAKLRLLITLTDGKPEDYDGYNDEYAIEDTRKALMEARGAGVHPFCINIDQKAGGYLRHMYGEGNYIFVQ